MSDEPLYCPGCGQEDCTQDCDWWARYLAYLAAPGDKDPVPKPVALYCEVCGAREPCSDRRCGRAS